MKQLEKLEIAKLAASMPKPPSNEGTAGSNQAQAQSNAMGSGLGAAGPRAAAPAPMMGSSLAQAGGRAATDVMQGRGTDSYIANPALKLPYQRSNRGFFDMLKDLGSKISNPDMLGTGGWYMDKENGGFRDMPKMPRGNGTMPDGFNPYLMNIGRSLGTFANSVKNTVGGVRPGAAASKAPVGASPGFQPTDLRDTFMNGAGGMLGNLLGR